MSACTRCKRRPEAHAGWCRECTAAVKWIVSTYGALRLTDAQRRKLARRGIS